VRGLHEAPQDQNGDSPGSASHVERELARADGRFEEMWRSERREEEEPLAIRPDVEDSGDA
jgi:hypothetical protein